MVIAVIYFTTQVDSVKDIEVLCYVLEQVHCRARKVTSYALYMIQEISKRQN